jgi:hypothetical protein
MGQRFTASFDELIRNRYGAKAPDDSRFALRVEDLFASYYGLPATSQPPGGSKATSVVLSRTDDGESLRQRGVRGRNGQTGAPSGQYVAKRQSCGCGTEKGNEYVARRIPSSRPFGARQQSTSPSDVAFEECQVDLAEKAALPALPAPVTSPNVPAAPPPPSAPPEPSRVVQPEILPPERSTASSATDNDFLADMQSILMGQKVFDPETKKTVDKGRVAPSERPLPEAKNEQAIFDRIAQRMQYANAYDLGSIDLETRLSDFDAISDRQDRVAAARKVASTRTGNGSATNPSSEVGNEDFLRDLDEIREPARSQSQSSSALYSAPLFATGEHVRTGGDLYPERFRVGTGDGVLFSYGQIIAMADLYERVDDLMGAAPAELRRLKALIEQDTYYTTGSADKVQTGQWDEASGERYLKLAEQNYEHFSPNVLLKKTALGRARQAHGDNKSAWEEHHQRAITEAQRIYLASPDQSHFYEWPLIINAFGDHFLTDAFAAGHLINKDFTVALFKSKFLSGGKLTTKGKSFFQKVANKAWKGEVARRFSTLETVDYPVCALGWCLKWRPNLDSANMLSKVLIAAAEQETERIANFAVNALHDHFNEVGLEVTNDAGDGTWWTKGDSHLADTQVLPIIQRAVQQSMDDINDPAIMATNLNFGAFFERVWKHVPRPTPASLAELERLTVEYTNPDSYVLADAAAVIIGGEIESLIKLLVKESKLQAA